MLKTIIFDIDGTIIDTEEAIFKGLDTLLQEYSNRNAQKEDMRKVFGIPGVDGLISLGYPKEEAVGMHRKWANYSKESQHLVRVFPGMLDLLDQLKASGKQLAIVTSKTKATLANNFTPFGLDHYFEEIITSEDTREHKPSGEPLLECMRRMDADPASTIYIGDSIFDNRCAIHAGVKFGLAIWGSHTAEGYQADYLLEKPQDLLQYVHSGL